MKRRVGCCWCSKGWDRPILRTICMFPRQPHPWELVAAAAAACMPPTDQVYQTPCNAFLSVRILQQDGLSSSYRSLLNEISRGRQLLCKQLLPKLTACQHQVGLETQALLLCSISSACINIGVALNRALGIPMAV